MTRYIYPAIFKPEDRYGYSVFFPDLESCYTCGDDLQEAVFMAGDVLAFVLSDYEEEGFRASTLRRRFLNGEKHGK